MVRLVVLVLLGLVGCSSAPPVPESDEYHRTSKESSYQAKRLVLTSLSQGQHHPAVTQLFILAEEQRQNQNFSGAISYLDQARQIQPRNSQIFYRIAWLEYLRGNLQQADQFVRRARVFQRGDKTLADRLNYLDEQIKLKKGFD